MMGQSAMSGYYDRLVAAARDVAEYRANPDARLIHVPADVLDALIALARSTAVRS